MNDFENWELLPPQEQAQRISEHVATNAAPQIQALRQQMAAAISQREQMFGNYLTVLTTAMNRKLENPDLDLQQFMQKALDYQTGKVNPMEAAYAEVTRDSSMKKMQEDIYKKAREDVEQQRFNPARETPIYKQPALSRTQTKDAVRNEAAQKGIAWTDSDWGPLASTQEGK